MMGGRLARKPALRPRGSAGAYPPSWIIARWCATLGPQASALCAPGKAGAKPHLPGFRAHFGHRGASGPHLARALERGMD